MGWLLFEDEVRQLVEAFGYSAVRTPPSHDFGVDVVAESERRTVVVQCKLYGRGRVGGDAIMKLVGSRSYFGATDAVCITSSEFTKQARKIAEGAGIHLVDRELLAQLCRERRIVIPQLTVLLHANHTAHALRWPRTRIGRAQDNDVALADPFVSGYHAVIAADGLHAVLQDCGSHYGTRLNGLPAAHPRAITYGDRVECAGVALQVALLSPDGTLAGLVPV